MGAVEKKLMEMEIVYVHAMVEEGNVELSRILFGEDLRGMIGDVDVGVEGPLVRPDSPMDFQ
jgi:hypothetical protein